MFRFLHTGNRINKTKIIKLQYFTFFRTIFTQNNGADIQLHSNIYINAHLIALFIVIFDFNQY